MDEHYVTDDSILPSLAMDNPVEIRLSITAEHVTLKIGRRDWEWKRGHPDLVGAGTEMCAPFIPDDLPTQFPGDKP